MTSLGWVLAGFAAVVVVYSACAAVLVSVGRRHDARALAGFIPDCIVLVRRLLEAADVPRRHKFLLAALIAYLALPFDLVPDFIPVAGQADDAILTALVLRSILRASGPAKLRRHWPGPDTSLRVLLRLLGTPARAGRAIVD